MQILFQQFLGQNHSWSVVGQNLARAMLGLSHQVDLVSTNGDQFFPPDLVPYKKSQPQKIIIKTLATGSAVLGAKAEEKGLDYDLQISYTAPINFPRYLSHGKKNRFAIWNYETTVVPAYLIKYFSYPDLILPSSNFSKQIFAQNKIPESKMVVVPHGIDFDGLNASQSLQLKTKKSFKIGSNIAQIHFRKNLPGLLQAYGQAFTKQDDVCLVLKLSLKEPTNAHEVSFSKIFQQFKRKFPQHAEIEIISDFLPNIGSFYRSCDVIFSLPHAECFWLPGLEAAAFGKPSVVSRYGGQLDYLNDQNAFLIDGKMIQAPPEAQYWVDRIGSTLGPSSKAEMFAPDINQASEVLRSLYLAPEKLLEKKDQLIDLARKYSWQSAAQQILDLTS